MSEENRLSSLLSASFNRDSAPLIIFAYAIVATVIAGFAAPAAGLAILTLGLLTALSLALTEWRRGEEDEARDTDATRGAGYVFGPSERSSRAYLKNAQLRLAATSAAGSTGADTLDGPALDGRSDAPREGAGSPIERGSRSGTPRPLPTGEISETSTAA